MILPRLLVILLTLLPALFASGEAVTDVRELGANDVRTCLRHVSPAEGGNVSISSETAPRQHRKAMSVQSYRLNSPTTVPLSHGGARPVYDYTARHTLPQIFNTYRTTDPCMVQSEKVKGVEWHLYDSPVTGKGGLTSPAQNFFDNLMKQNPNFKVTYHGKL